MAPCGGSTREGDIYVRVLFAIRQVMMYTGEAVDAQDRYLVPRVTLRPWRTSTDRTGGLGYLSDRESGSPETSKESMAAAQLAEISQA